MKILKSIPVLLLFLITFNSAAQTRLPMCESYANWTLAKANENLSEALEAMEMLTSCEGDDWSTCRVVFDLLYDTEDILTQILNGNIDSGQNCVKCNLTSAIATATLMDFIALDLKDLGYSISMDNGISLTMKQWKEAFECDNANFEPEHMTIRHPIEGNWTSNTGHSVDIVYNKFNDKYELTVSAGAFSTAYFQDQERLFAEDWNTTGWISFDGNTITWDNQIWTRGGGSTSVWSGADPGEYVVRYSGSGYRKMHGSALKIDGEHLFIFRLNSGNINDLFDKWKTEAAVGSRNSCDRGPALCPCPAWPDIWVDGPHYEIVEYGADFATLWRKYECANNNIQQRQPCIDWNSRVVDYAELPCN